MDVGSFNTIALTAIDSSKWDNLDGINAENEAIRIAASSGVKALQSLVCIKSFFFCKGHCHTTKSYLFL